MEMDGSSLSQGIFTDVHEADDSLSTFGHHECLSWRDAVVTKKSRCFQFGVNLRGEVLDFDLIIVDVSGTIGLHECPNNPVNQPNITHKGILTRLVYGELGLASQTHRNGCMPD